MKKILHTFCIFGLALNIHAQSPTLTGADLPMAGMSFIVSNDTLPDPIIISQGITSPGPWDFTSLTPNYPKSAVYGYTSNTPFAADFPTSNIYTYGPSIFFSSLFGGAPVDSVGNGYMFWSSDNSGLKVIGWRADSGPYSGKNIFVNPPELLIGTPSTLGTVFNNFSKWELPMNDNPLDVDTFFITERTKTLTTDYVSSLTTPYGAFNNVQRIHENVIQIDSVIGKIGITVVSATELSRDTSNNYIFMTNGIGYPVAIVHADVNNSVKDVEYLTDTTCSIWTHLTGTVYDNFGVVNLGEASLLQFINDSTPMPVIASTVIDAGYFAFNDIPEGDYMILAKGDPVLYPNDIPTYYGGFHRWDSSIVFNTLCADTFFNKDIFLIEKLVWSGSGFCNGTIRYGLKTGKYIGEPGAILGDPADGLDITIEQIPGGQAVQFTTTDTSGKYSFGNLDTSVSGYNLYVNIPGLLMDSTYKVMIINPTDSVFNLDFVVDTTAGSGLIFIATSTSIWDILLQPLYNISVFPNPFSDAARFKISGGNEGEVYRLEIHDITGRTVKLVDNIFTTIELDKGELTPGLYIYKVLNKNGLIGLGKLVVQ